MAAGSVWQEHGRVMPEPLALKHVVVAARASASDGRMKCASRAQQLRRVLARARQ